MDEPAAIFHPYDPDIPITRGDLGMKVGLDPGKWPSFRKTAPINAIRVAGPFKVETSEGELTCADGWLCVDARGYPYPVADEEFQLIYKDASATSLNDLRQTALDTLSKLAQSNDQKVAHMAANTILAHTTNNTGGT